MNTYIRDINHEYVNTTVTDLNNYSNVVMNFNIKSLRVFQMNIRSIAKNLDELKVMLSTLTTDFDIIVLTETHILLDVNIFKINGYGIVYNEGDYNRNDGVVVFVREIYNFSCRNVYLGPCKALELKFKTDNKTVLITAIYRSPSSRVDNFIAALGDYLHTMKRTLKHFHILVGDINIDILKDNNDDTSNYLNLMSEYGYISMINKPTRIYNDSSSCIDHIFLWSSNECEKKCLPIILETCITDHFSTILFLPFVLQNVISKCRILCNTNLKKLKIDLQSTDWQHFYNITDAQTATTYFLNILQKKIRYTQPKLK